MPLLTAGKAIGAALFKATNSQEGTSAENAWAAVGEEIAKQIVMNAQITGIAPPNGGPLIDGRIA